MVEPVATGGMVAAATALVKPIEKLIEVCAAGVGTLYEPTKIRRRARAEGDAKVLLEEAEARKNEVAVRAAHRMLDTEERRQKNIDAVVEQARLALPAVVSAEAVDEDWIARFFGHVQDIGNESMQLLWGKLLAGEVASPGTFSPRTLRIVSDLTAHEANLFENLSSLRVVTLGARTPFLFYTSQDEAFTSLGLSWGVIQGLDSAGLVRDHGLTTFQINQSPGPLLFEAAGGTLFHLTTETPRRLPLGKVSFTPAGTEMCRLASWLWNDVHMRNCVAAWRAEGWVVTARSITKRIAPGQVETTEMEMPV